MDQVCLAAEAKAMCLRRPADGIEKGEVVLTLRLVSSRSGSNLEGRKRELVGKRRHVRVRTIDAQVRGGDDRYIDSPVVYPHKSKAEFVQQSRTEQVRFGDAEEAIMHRQLIREIQITAT